MKPEDPLPWSPSQDLGAPSAQVGECHPAPTTLIRTGDQVRIVSVTMTSTVWRSLSSRCSYGTLTWRGPQNTDYYLGSGPKSGDQRHTFNFWVRTRSDPAEPFPKGRMGPCRPVEHYCGDIPRSLVGFLRAQGPQSPLFSEWLRNRITDPKRQDVCLKKAFIFSLPLYWHSLLYESRANRISEGQAGQDYVWKTVPSRDVRCIWKLIPVETAYFDRLF